jgi:hypothetical protein
MKQGIRALNVTIIISMILVIIYLATALYSVTELFLFNQDFTFEDFEFDVSGDALTISAPVALNNTGYYDVNRFQITTILVDDVGELIDETSTVANGIPPHENMDLQHNLVLDFVDLLTTRQDLLFTDTVFNLTLQFNLLYAYALEFEVEIQDTKLPWGAPLAQLNLTSDAPVVNSTHLLLNMTLEAENHAPFDLNGSLIFEIYNEHEEFIGQGTELVSLLAISDITLPLEIAAFLENPGALTGRGIIIVSFTAPQIMQPIEVWRESYG